MNAKRLVILLILVLFVAMPLGQGTAKSAPPNKQVGILTNNETGKSFQIPVMVLKTDLGNGRTSVEYSADIPKSILETNAIGKTLPVMPIGDSLSESKENSHNDTTNSAKVYIYMSYSSKYIGGFKYSKVDFYKGKWVRLDPAVSCTKMEIKAACFGDSEPGSPGTCAGDGEDRISTRSNPTTGVYYQYTPPWAGLYIEINDYAGHLGSTKVFLLCGGTSWTFELAVCEGGYWGIC